MWRREKSFPYRDSSSDPYALQPYTINYVTDSCIQRENDCYKQINEGDDIFPLKTNFPRTYARTQLSRSVKTVHSIVTSAELAIYLQISLTVDSANARTLRYNYSGFVYSA
jgi:hypothetical protein